MTLRRGLEHAKYVGSQHMVDGYFDSTSVVRRIHSDPSALVGGIRSLIVQALQPRAMAGVAQHSTFKDDFWGRLRRTSGFLQTFVFGDKEAADASSAVVRAVHSRVTGVDAFTGLAYRADEPELLIWVHNATVESHLFAYRRFGSNVLDMQSANEYVSEMSLLGVLMGLDHNDVAHTVADLDAYFASYRKHLAGSPDAKVAVRALLQAALPIYLRPMWDIPAAAAVTSLPEDFRRMLDLDWVRPFEPGVRVVTQLFLRGLGFIYPAPEGV